MGKKTNIEKLREAGYQEMEKRTEGIKKEYEVKKAALKKEMEALEKEYSQKHLEIEAAAAHEENEAAMARMEQVRLHRTLKDKKKALEKYIQHIAYVMNNNDPKYLEGIRKAIFKL